MFGWCGHEPAGRGFLEFGPAQEPILVFSFNDWGLSMTSAQKIILARHGESTSTLENPQRPLAITGRQHAEQMASWLERCGYQVEEIVHSSKLRARQTAKIFGSRLGLHAAHVREVPGLKPNDDPDAMAEIIELDRRSIVIVSHLPFLNRLTSLLLAGDPQRLQFQFSDAGTVILARVSGGWRVEAVVGHQMV
jgi:phosphohistidine phosphatase